MLPRRSHSSSSPDAARSSPTSTMSVASPLVAPVSPATTLVHHRPRRSTQSTYSVRPALGTHSASPVGSVFGFRSQGTLAAGTVANVSTPCSGSLLNVYGLSIEQLQGTAGAVTINNNFGIYVGDRHHPLGGLTTNNSFGIYIDTQTG